MDTLINIQNTFLQKDNENNFIFEKHDMNKIIDNISTDELYNALFSCEEIMNKLSATTVLSIYKKIIHSIYNDINHIKFWHLCLLVNIYKKSDSEVKIICYDHLNKLKLNYTPESKNLLISNKIYIKECFVNSYFTSEQLQILKLDQDTMFYYDDSLNTQIIFSWYSEDQIYYDLFLSTNFLKNLSLNTLIQIFNRIIESKYNKNKYLLSQHLDILLTKYSSDKLMNKNYVIDIIKKLNYDFSEEIITILIKNYFYWEKYFSNELLTQNKFFVIVLLNSVIDFSEKSIDKFTNFIDFFLLVQKKHNLTYNLLTIKKFVSLLKFFTKNHNAYLNSKYGYMSNNSTAKLGFIFKGDNGWYRC